MFSKNQWRILAIVLAVALLVVSFLTGVMGIVDNLGPVKEAQSAYADFHDELSALRENDAFLAEGKAEYESAKADYDAEFAAYEDEYGKYEDAEVQYSKDVLEYNTQLIAYSAGKNALGGAAGSAVSEGKSKLDEGWKLYNEGKAAYDAGLAEFEKQKQEYEKGVSMYEYMLNSIEALEASGMSHDEALAAVGAQAGIELSDEYIAQMKAGIDTAQALIPEAEKKLSEGKAQLDAAYDQLMLGEAGLETAQAQIASAKAQLDSMRSSIASGPARLDEQGQSVSDSKSELDARKSELDAKAEELSVYEDVSEKVSRARDKLIDQGFGDNAAGTEQLISSAGAHEAQLRSEYLKTLISFILTYAGHLLAVASAVAALLLLRKNKLPAAIKLSVVGVALGLISVIASIVFGDLDTLAFAAAVLTAAGVGLTAAPAEDE